MNENPHRDEPDEMSAQINDDIDWEIANALGDHSIEQLMEESTQQISPPPDKAQTDSRAAPSADGSGSFNYELKRGRIRAVHGEDVFVDLAGVDSKLQGVVPLKQFDRSPREGSVMDFNVERIDEAEGLVYLSREGAVSQATWQQLQRGAVVEARVVSTNKGGLELEMVGGIQAFMPASQIELHHVEALEPYVGQKMRGVVQEIDRRSRTVVISRRRHLEHERLVQRQKLLAELEPGQTLTGTVANIVQYGVFVDLGGLDGMVHISDMSYSHIDTPDDAVTVGQKLTVKVLKVDKEAQKIRLGLKQVEPDPWDAIEQRIQEGEQVTGRVLRNTDFGSFVEIEPGVEALLPRSEISWRRVHKPSEVLKEGDVLRLLVLKVDPTRQRISLSLKQAQGDPWHDINERYPRGRIVETTVIRTTQFGAFVELEAGVEGLVHISELADRHVKNVEDVLQVGQQLKLRVLEVSLDHHRIKLSLKAVVNDPTGAEPQVTTQKATKPRHRDDSLKGGLGISGAMGRGLGELKL